MSFEQQRTVVHGQLQRQLAHIGSSIHTALGEVRAGAPHSLHVSPASTASLPCLFEC